MRIAFFSYEYPPETGGGGIGTYLAQMVYYLPRHEHVPVVFCATAKKEAFWENEYVYRLPASSWGDFNKELPNHFRKIHEQNKFDIVEATDFRAGGIEIRYQFPMLPFVVRAHTANYLIDIFLFEKLTGVPRIRFIIGALRRFCLPSFPTPPNENAYLIEKEIIEQCTSLLSPSKALGDMYHKIGWLKQYEYVPFFYEPQQNILNILPRKKAKDEINIVFYGRLEIRKGVLEIAKAIPVILKRHPQLNFYFYGQPANSPKHGYNMQEYLEKKLSKCLNNVFFKGAFQAADLVEVLSQGDIFIFPSRFDSFGIACCEAMAAGKAVIGSRSGGMAEIIEDGLSGLLLDPNNAAQIVDKISLLVNNQSMIANMGENGRKRILNEYSAAKNIPLLINTYNKAIEKNYTSPFIDSKRVETSYL